MSSPYRQRRLRCQDVDLLRLLFCRDPRRDTQQAVSVLGFDGLRIDRRRKRNSPAARTACRGCRGRRGRPEPSVQVVAPTDRLRARFSSSNSFHFDSSYPAQRRLTVSCCRISGRTRGRPTPLARNLLGHPRARHAERTTGHIGTAEYDLALGNRRASSVRDYLASRGVPADRLQAISCGEERAGPPERHYNAPR